MLMTRYVWHIIQLAVFVSLFLWVFYGNDGGDANTYENSWLTSKAWSAFLWSVLGAYILFSVIACLMIRQYWISLVLLYPVIVLTIFTALGKRGLGLFPPELTEGAGLLSLLGGLSVASFIICIKHLMALQQVPENREPGERPAYRKHLEGRQDSASSKVDRPPDG